MPIRRLSDPVQYLKGVGPARGQLLADLGIRTAGDLLHYFPRDLAHLPGRVQISACRSKDCIGQVVTVGGALRNCRFHGQRFRPVLSCRLFDSSGSIDATWFNAGWMRGKFTDGDNVVLMGKLRPGRYGPELVNPKISFENSERADRASGDQWDPVYPASAGISSQQIQQMIRRNLPSLLRLVEEFFAPRFLREHKLLDRWLAVAWMHFPAASAQACAAAPGGGVSPASSPAAVMVASPDDERPLDLETDLAPAEVSARHAAARRRLAWDEAFLFQLAMAMRRRSRHARLRAAALPCSGQLRQRILRRFPFELTAAQQRVIEQITCDLARPSPMNRLLQGDVGSGKTVVALFAALLAVAHGQQAAIMAPTEILASQHHARITQYLSGSRVRWALLTGSLPAGERNRIHAALSAGELDLVVGTSALLSDRVRFARLAVAVVDEQHKFGVRQRAQLQNAPADSPPALATSIDALVHLPGHDAAEATVPHTLVMTATPIPRSLALTVFGDLAVSTIDASPPGRGQTQTRVVAPANREQALDFIESRLAGGGQAFVVCPRIGGDDAEDDSEPDDAESRRQEMASAEQVYRDLQPRFSRHGIALVHGQMDRDRQEAVLAAFAAGRVRALVATTVIEVGVDIARANVMAVFSAERFGLAQLHQLRGRIGRSAEIARSYCLLFVGAAEHAARLAILEQTSDGFCLAEEDLARRGPGQFFGLAQHGVPEFVHVDLARDLPLLREARTTAFKMIESDPGLSLPRNANLRRTLLARYGQSLPLIDAG